MFLRWDLDDQAKALAWLEREQRTCRCGTDPDEWVTVPDENGRSEFLIPPRYEAEVRFCNGCAEIERFESSLGKNGPGPGERVVLRHVEPHEYDRGRWSKRPPLIAD